MAVQIKILRMGHRKERDKRVTTHVFLTGRALGATSGILCGEEDEKMSFGVEKVGKKWGEKFRVSYAKSPAREILKAKKAGFATVHLTMYGERLQDKIKEIRREKKVMAIVGAEKVSTEIYELCDYNIGVTSQPHSEVAALAVFLHEYFQGKELGHNFKGAKIAIVPSKKVKTVRSLK